VLKNDWEKLIKASTTRKVIGKKEEEYHQRAAAGGTGLLRKIAYRELKLFEVCHGTFVEGKIVGEVVQPMVGGTTLILDNQDVLLVCFYNLLPDGILGSSAEPLLQAMLPLGATLRIKEPFYKIFGDGQRGIRVDNP
jgi:hypothetical protein